MENSRYRIVVVLSCTWRYYGRRHGQSDVERRRMRPDHPCNPYSQTLYHRTGLSYFAMELWTFKQLTICRVHFLGS